MAIVFMTGDSYHSDAVITDAGRSEQFVRDGWWAYGLGGTNAPYYYPAGGPFGTGCWAHSRYSSQWSILSFPSSGPTIYSAAWVYHTGPSMDCNLWRMGYGLQGEQYSIYLVSGGAIRFYRYSGNLLGTSSAGVITADRWHHVALKVLLHDSTGTVDIEVDGNNVLSLTSQDTKAQTSALVDYIGFEGDENFGQRFCQPIVWTNSGDAPTDFFGQHRIWTLRPNGDTAQADFTPQGAGANYVEVDDVEADDDTTYNYASTTADEDRLDLESLPETPDVIYAVQSRVLAKQTSAGALSLKNGVYAGSTKSVGSARVCGLNYAYHTNLFTVNPDDSAAWEEADVNGAAIEYEIG